LQGWNQRHDEKIPHSSTIDRFLAYTPANVERARAEIRDAQARLSSKKKRKSVLDEKRSSGAESRGSTPSDKRSSSLARGANIAIPALLKEILIDDQDMINRQMHLTRVPARVNVIEIIRQDTVTFVYGADGKLLEDNADSLIESSFGLQDYFNCMLGTQLLYKFERPQYADLVASLKDTEKQQEGAKDSKKKRETGEPEPKRKREADEVETKKKPEEGEPKKKKKRTSEEGEGKCSYCITKRFYA
uniref:MRG domain-containing protein n=1 Tax=Gongylonema pulchrum TaxID=637853 RepID=A0A183E3J5_9BILA